MVKNINMQKMKWISSSTLPPIDEDDRWCLKNKISKDLLCYSKSWGKRNGRYFHDGGFWTVDGISSSDGVFPEYWIDVEIPSQEEIKEIPIDKIKTALANYMFSEGCSYCREDIEAHKKHEEELAKLLGVEKYEDGSGYDFSKYRSK